MNQKPPNLSIPIDNAEGLWLSFDYCLLCQVFAFLQLLSREKK